MSASLPMKRRLIVEASLLLALLWMPVVFLPAHAQARLSTAEGSHIRMEVLEDRAEVLQVLHLKNEADTELSPPGGLMIDLPQGATDLREDESVKTDPSGVRARVPGPFTSGVSVVRLRYALPVEEGRVDFVQQLGLETEQMSVILPELPGVVAVGESVRGVAQRAAEGMSFMVIDLAIEGDRVAFRLEGLPVRPSWPRWISLFCSLAIVAGGLAMVARARLQRGLSDPEQEKIALLDALARIEIDREEGMAEHEQGAICRAELMTRLASVLKKEAERDETS